MELTVNGINLAEYGWVVGKAIQPYRHKQHTDPSFDIEDLEQIAQIALWDSARRFDHSRGFQFSSFAVPRVNGAVLDSLRKMLPSSRWELRVAREEGTEDELIESRYTASLDKVFFGDDGQKTLADFLASDEPSAFELMDKKEREDVLWDEIEKLSNERYRFTMYLILKEHMTLKQAGEFLGVTEGRACQIVARVSEIIYPHLYARLAA